MPSRSDHTARPRIAVLLATHNGERWLDEQLDSILGQRDVSVRVIAMDDGSSDGTRQLLERRAEAEQRLTILQGEGRAGSAARNFYRLIANAKIEDGEIVALADQDDLWAPNKLSRHSDLLESLGCDGVSSSVTSFTPNGQRSLIRKDYPQRNYDFLLEGPGPGSTFLFSRRLLDLMREVLARTDVDAISIEHDWLIYAVARAAGWSWHIDSTPSVDYRQHDTNAMGSNVGLRSGMSRLAMIRSGWHRRQSELIAQIGASVAPEHSRGELQAIHDLLIRPGVRSRLSLARLAGQLRRRPRDRAIIGVLIAIGVW
ncbi:MAG: glycosyltransferase [Rhodoglobus sp.]|nr:glycosyltransferase [Rhodoglobus sp.]